MRTITEKITYRGMENHKVATPADWQPRDDVIVPPPDSCGVAQDRVQGNDGAKCLDWFRCLKENPNSELDLPPMWK